MSLSRAKPSASRKESSEIYYIGKGYRKGLLYKKLMKINEAMFKVEIDAKGKEGTEIGGQLKSEDEQDWQRFESIRKDLLKDPNSRKSLKMTLGILKESNIERNKKTNSNSSEIKTFI